MSSIFLFGLDHFLKGNSMFSVRIAASALALASLAATAWAHSLCESVYLTSASGRVTAFFFGEGQAIESEPLWREVAAAEVPLTFSTFSYYIVRDSSGEGFVADGHPSNETVVHMDVATGMTQGNLLLSANEALFIDSTGLPIVDCGAFTASFDPAVSATAVVSACFITVVDNVHGARLCECFVNQSLVQFAKAFMGNGAGGFSCVVTSVTACRPTAANLGLTTPPNRGLRQHECSFPSTPDLGNDVYSASSAFYSPAIRLVQVPSNGPCKCRSHALSSAAVSSVGAAVEGRLSLGEYRKVRYGLARHDVAEEGRRTAPSEGLRAASV